MKSPIERAFALGLEAEARTARMMLPTIEKEFIEARDTARQLWAEILKREGLKPDDLFNYEVLMVSDENVELSVQYQVAAKLLARAITKYKDACRALNVEPVLLTEARERYIRKHKTVSKKRVTRKAKSKSSSPRVSPVPPTRRKRGRR